MFSRSESYRTRRAVCKVEGSRGLWYHPGFRELPKGERAVKIHIRKSNIKKIRKSGFRARMKTLGGRKALSRRRFQGKKRLTNI